MGHLQDRNLDPRQDCVHRPLCSCPPSPSPLRQVFGNHNVPRIFEFLALDTPNFHFDPPPPTFSLGPEANRLPPLNTPGIYCSSPYPCPILHHGFYWALFIIYYSKIIPSYKRQHRILKLHSDLYSFFSCMDHNAISSLLSQIY